MEWRSIEEGKSVALGDIWIWEVKDREVSRMTPGFLAFVTGWVVVPDPERGKAGAGGVKDACAGQSAVDWDTEFSLQRPQHGAVR